MPKLLPMLTRIQREVVTLVIGERLPHRLAAARLGVKRAAVTRSFNRGMERLRAAGVAIPQMN